MSGQAIQYLADGTWADIDGNPIPAPKPGLMLPVTVSTGKINITSGVCCVGSISNDRNLRLTSAPIAVAASNYPAWIPNEAGHYESNQ